ncbi:hypothetical protein BKA21_003288 [Cellulomonas oligotrophica]|uniref:Uncharacterized protein n=2 Tax=Cellulomonas oligotrophica TaxID=931536 RepID=A0A7Y9K0D3_9CELL|nr:hypothetical protein [Cellulomonas oligotrophica]NYD87739.1 hypothetical protein [Cellulomonas oligotrophica]
MRTAPLTCGTMVGENPVRRRLARAHQMNEEIDLMSKRGRKRRSRKGNAANHGKRPNA